jgi:hypothetical protein
MPPRRAQVVFICAILIWLMLGTLAALLFSHHLEARFTHELLLRQEQQEGCLARADLTGECIPVPDETSRLKSWMVFNFVTTGRPALAEALDAAAWKALTIAFSLSLALLAPILVATTLWTSRRVSNSTGPRAKIGSERNRDRG